MADIKTFDKGGVVSGVVTDVPDETQEVEVQPFAELPAMQGLDTHYAHANHWVGYVPLENVLGRSFSNLQLNLTDFDVPQMVIGSSSVQFKGYTYEVPTHVIDPDTKEITFNYIVDQNFYNYKSLFTFASQVANFNPVDDQTVDGPLKSNLIDVRVWLLDNYKKRVVDFVFHNCWIKVFGNLHLDYKSADEVVHSFTLAYSNYEIMMSHE